MNLSIVLLRNVSDRPVSPGTVVQIANQNIEQLLQEGRLGNI